MATIDLPPAAAAPETDYSVGEQDQEGKTTQPADRAKREIEVIEEKVR